MRLRSPLLVLGLAAGLAALPLSPGCGPAEEDPREAVLRHIADAGSAGARDFAESAAELSTATRSLCTAPSLESLGETQASWGRARQSWSRHLAFGFGPAKEQSSAIDFWPVRVDTVEEAIAEAPEVLDSTYVGGLGVSAKGLPALEYVLFGDGEGAEEVVGALRGPEGSGGPRCAYAVILTEDIAARAETIAVAWETEYADELRLAGQGSALFATRKEAVDTVINHLIDALATVVNAKLDAPLGNLSGTPPEPEALESRFSAATVEDLQANLEGLWLAYHGEVGEEAAGISVLVAAAGGDSDVRTREQYGVALEAVTALPTPAGAALVSERSRFQTARDEIDTLRRLLKLDVASLLGVVLTLSDNDGD